MQVVQTFNAEWKTKGSASTGQLAEQLQALEGDYYVVLDEADHLHETAVLYDLHEAPLHLVLVGNSEAESLAGADDRVESRPTAGRRLCMDEYTTSELSSILRECAEDGL